MKKLLTVITLLVYVAVSTGFVVSVHYCMNEVNGFELGHSNLETCSNCGMAVEDKDGCCKEEVRVVKMQVDQNIATATTTSFSLPVIITFTSQFLFTPLVTQDVTTYALAHSPPLNEQDIYLQNSVFRI